MASGDNDIVYKVSEDDKSDDLLDDEALIKAYNRAVSTTENDISSSKQPAAPGTGSHKKQKNKGNKKTDAHHTQQKTREWKVGDFCRCVYSADGLCYEAKVKSLDHDGCVVRYVGYGNEEEVYLSELLPSEGKAARQRQTDQAKRENAQGSPTPPSDDDHGASATHGHRTHEGYSQSHDTPFLQSHPPLPPAPPVEPLLNRLPPFMKQSIPPPPIPHGEIPNSEEALASMLMSWYMAGYHTGYYQGSQESKTAKRECCCCRYSGHK